MGRPWHLAVAKELSMESQDWLSSGNFADCYAYEYENVYLYLFMFAEDRARCLATEVRHVQFTFEP